MNAKSKVELKGWQWFLLGVLVALMLVGGLTACYQGRKISRWTGQAVHVKLPEDVRSYDQVVSISFHKNESSETIKDVTFVGAMANCTARNTTIGASCKAKSCGNCRSNKPLLVSHEPTL